MSTLTGWPPVPPLSGFDLPVTCGLNPGLSRLFSPLSLSIVVIVVSSQYFLNLRRAKKHRLRATPKCLKFLLPIYTREIFWSRRKKKIGYALRQAHPNSLTLYYHARRYN